MLQRCAIWRSSQPIGVVLLAVFLALTGVLLSAPAPAQAGTSTPTSRLCLPLVLRALNMPPGATPTFTATPTATPSPRRTPTSTNAPTARPTPPSTDVPTATPTSTDLPTSTPTSTNVPTATPTATSTDVPTATPTSTDLPTSTPTVAPPTATPSPTPTWPTSGPSSEELIDQALARGEISSETALVYKVYVAYADPRLPVPYRGDDSQMIESSALDDAAAAFATLSPAAQAELAPFFLPPLYSNSWFGQRTTAAKGAGEVLATAEPRPCGSQITQWTAIDVPGAGVRVWYYNTGGSVTARLVASAIETQIWPKLMGLVGTAHAPVSDGGVFGCNGGDERLDIYLVPGSFLAAGEKGKTIPHLFSWGGGTVGLPFGCSRTPVWVLLPEALVGRELDAAATHEIMHAIQWSYKTKKCQGEEYKWLREATATWAIDYVYPSNQYERDTFAASFLEVPRWSLEVIGPRKGDGKEHEYGAYLFFFYLAHRIDPKLIAYVWEATEGLDSLAAVNSALAGVNGLEKQWPEFTTYNWNQPPVDDYRRWDSLDQVAKSVAVDVDLGPAGDAKIPLPLGDDGLAHLSARYFHIKFPDPQVRSVAFYNGYTFKVSEQDVDQRLGHSWVQYGVQLTAEALTPQERKGAHVTALIKIAGKDWQAVDYTDLPYFNNCQDDAARRIEEMVLIFSNSLYEPRDDTSRRKPKDLPPTLWVSDMGCRRWHGSSNYDSVNGSFKVPEITWTWTGWLAAPSLETRAAADFWWAGDVMYYPSGTLQFTIRLTDGCPVDLTTPILLRPQENSTDFLVTNNWTTSGPLYRAYFWQGFSTKPVTGTCPYPHGDITQTWDYFSFTVPHVPNNSDRVKVGGIIDFEGPDPWGAGTTTQKWHLEPVSDP